MQRRIVAPLILLSSITFLTSCMDRGDKKMPVVKMPTETAIPVEIVTTPIVATGTQIPPIAETIPAPATPATVTPVVPVPVVPVAPVVPPVSTARTRTETVSYRTPAGSDLVEFSVTVEAGVITAARATVKAENDKSQRYQTGFAADVSSKVVGKKIADLDLSAIGGASLTTGAFDQFVRSF